MAKRANELIAQLRAEVLALQEAAAAEAVLVAETAAAAALLATKAAAAVGMPRQTRVGAFPRGQLKCRRRGQPGPSMVQRRADPCQDRRD
jgi:hypothetical protein